MKRKKVQSEVFGIIDSIVSSLMKYSAQPAITNTAHEHMFLEFLKKDFEVYKYYEVKESYKNNSLQYVFCKSRNITSFTSQFFFTVHVDRIGKFVTPYVDTISFDKTNITGQLDNIISIAVLKFLYDLGYSFNFLFTTKEEIFQSYSQVLEIARSESLIPISLDIDVFEELSEFQNGEITIRERDINADMHADTVKMLQKIANSISVPYFSNEGYTSVETGYMSKKTNNKVQGAHIGIPITNYHTDEEQTLQTCVLNIIKLLKRILS